MRAMTASVHASISRRKDLTVTNKNGVTPVSNNEIKNILCY